MVAAAEDKIERCLGLRNVGIATSDVGLSTFNSIFAHEDATMFTICVIIALMFFELEYDDIRVVLGQAPGSVRFRCRVRGHEPPTG